MTVNYAETQPKVAYLSSDFGVELACKKFGFTPEQLEEKVGRYVRGPRKGLLKGSITWHKVVRGGWVKTGAYDHDEQRAHGFVAKLGVAFAFTLEDAQGELIAEKDVVWDVDRNTRSGKSINVWSSYRLQQDKKRYLEEQERRKSQPVVQPDSFIVIRLQDGTFGTGYMRGVAHEELQGRIGEYVTVEDLLTEQDVTGAIVRVIRG